MRGDLNFHHLRYFHTVAHAGSIAKACETLHVAQPTISAQLKDLEQNLGEPVFARVGRRLELTDTGRLVLRYCDEIFALGSELTDTLSGKGPLRVAILQVGIVDVIPKLIAHRLLAPALAANTRIQCREDPPEKLFAELAVHALDIVISDRPLLDNGHTATHCQELGHSGIGLFGLPANFGHLRDQFPHSLNDQPLLVPSHGSQVRSMLAEYCHQRQVTPRIIVECEDNSLLLAFARAGAGLVPVSTVLAAELKHMHGLELIGTLNGLVEHYYAVTIDRRLDHPGVLAVTSGAKDLLLQ